jgi:hypothetical protein
VLNSTDSELRYGQLHTTLENDPNQSIDSWDDLKAAWTDFLEVEDGFQKNEWTQDEYQAAENKVEKYLVKVLTEVSKY